MKKQAKAIIDVYLDKRPIAGISLNYPDGSIAMLYDLLKISSGVDANQWGLNQNISKEEKARNIECNILENTQNGLRLFDKSMPHYNFEALRNIYIGDNKPAEYARLTLSYYSHKKYEVSSYQLKTFYIEDMKRLVLINNKG